jgi:hypothetical protein
MFLVCFVANDRPYYHHPTPPLPLPFAMCNEANIYSPGEERRPAQLSWRKGTRGHDFYHDASWEELGECRDMAPPSACVT